MNRHRPHVLIIPEDDANSRIARGFDLGLDHRHRIQILRPVGGWTNVLDNFNSYHASKMRSFPHRYCVLLIDFDRDAGRFREVAKNIPVDIAERVFVVGALSEPEDLRRELAKSFEKIGMALADECRNDVYSTWQMDLLKHNETELRRLRTVVRLILFP